MAVLFRYFVKRDLSSVRYSTRVHWTSHFLQGKQGLTGHLTCIEILKRTTLFYKILIDTAVAYRMYLYS